MLGFCYHRLNWISQSYCRIRSWIILRVTTRWLFKCLWKYGMLWWLVLLCLGLHENLPTWDRIQLPIHFSVWLMGCLLIQQLSWSCTYKRLCSGCRWYQLNQVCSQRQTCCCCYRGWHCHLLILHIRSYYLCCMWYQHRPRSSCCWLWCWLLHCKELMGYRLGRSRIR